MSDNTVGMSSPFPSSDKENEQHASTTIAKAAGIASPAKTPSKIPSKTPSKSRVSLGAPANFYFKYMNSSKKTAASCSSMMDESMNEGNLTGTISIPGLNRSVNLADTSLLSLGASSSGSSDQSEIDLLNKSTLSDTTDLTASNFVLQATSRHVMRQFQLQAQSAKKKSPPSVESEEGDKTKTLAVEAEAPTEENEPREPSSSSKDVSSSPTGSAVSFAQHTSKEEASAPRRQSFQGFSPSLRQRMSATPQSLQKLTEDLRNQRMNRQAKQDAMRRLSIDSKNSTQSLQSLNAQLESFTANNRIEAENAATLDRKRLPPSFAQPLTKTTVVEAPSSALNKTCTTQEIRGAMEEIFAEQEDGESSSDSSRSSSQGWFQPDVPHANEAPVERLETRSPNCVPTSIEVKNGRSQNIMMESSLLASADHLNYVAAPGSPSSPMTKASPATSVRLRRGLTPTKLSGAPRRVLNPAVLDSPAKNTRSSAKKKRLSELHPIEEVGTLLQKKVSNEEAVLFAEVASPTHLESKPVDIGLQADPAKYWEDDIVSLTGEEGDTASLEDLGVVAGSLNKRSPKNKSTPTICAESLVDLAGNEENGTAEKQASLRNLSWAMDSAQRVDETSQPDDALVEQQDQPSMGNEGPTDVSGDQESGDNTAYLGDLSRILGNQIQMGQKELAGAMFLPLDTNQGSDEASMHYPEYVEEEQERLSIANNTHVSHDGGGETASFTDLSSILGNTRKGQTSPDEKRNSLIEPVARLVPAPTIDQLNIGSDEDGNTSFRARRKATDFSSPGAETKKVDADARSPTQSEGDTASIGDISYIFKLSQSRSPMSTNTPAPRSDDASVEVAQEQPNMGEGGPPHMSRDQECEDNTESIADFARILGRQTETGQGVSGEAMFLSLDANQGSDEASVHDSVCVEMGREQLSIANNTPMSRDGGGQTASLTDLSSILGRHRGHTPRGQSSPDEERNSLSESVAHLMPAPTIDQVHGRSDDAANAPFDARTKATEFSLTEVEATKVDADAWGPTQRDGETASIGDISDTFKFSRGRSSISSNTSAPRSVSGSINSSTFLSVLQNPPTPERPKPPPFSESQELSNPSPGSPKVQNGGDTASLSDLVDILGNKGSPLIEVNSPGSAHSKDDKYSPHERIRTQFSQTPSNYNLTQDSFGYAQRFQAGSDDGQETASLADLAEILGSAPSQTQDSNTPASKISSTEEDSPSANTIKVKTKVLDVLDNDMIADADIDPHVVEDLTVRVALDDDEAISAFSSKKRSRSSSSKPSELVAASPIERFVGSIRVAQPSPSKSTPSKSLNCRTPNSQMKPTPTKVAPSPPRIPNPQYTNSPAKNTRSTKNTFLQLEREAEALDTSASKRRLPELTKEKVNGEVLSSIGGLPLIACDREKSTQMSPVARPCQPVGILSSRKKMRSAVKPSQRSVAFGSPEAAEYHVGSPSVSMTPMLPSRAKELYSIPRDIDLSGEGSSASNSASEDNVEMEADLNILVDKISVGNMKESPQLSPILNARDDTCPVVLPGNYRLSKSKPDDDLQSVLNDSSIDVSCMHNTSGEGLSSELETGIIGLIDNVDILKQQASWSVSCNNSQPNALPATFVSSANREWAMGEPKHDNSALSPTESSVEMTDAKSIASSNSAKPDTFTTHLLLNAHKLDFMIQETGNSEASDESMDIDEGFTGDELENGMTGFLAAPEMKEILFRRIQSPVENMSTMPVRLVQSINSKPAKIVSETEQEHKNPDSPFAPSTIVFNDDESAISKRSRESTTFAPSTIAFDDEQSAISKRARRNSIVETSTMALDCDESFFSTRSQRSSMATNSALAIDVGESVVSKRSRRSSIANHRCTLDTGDRLQISSDGSFRVPESLLTDERSVSFKSPESTKVHPSVSFSPETLTLSFDEILRLSGITGEDFRPRARFDRSDAIVHFSNSTKNAIEQVSQRLEQVIQAVCGEVGKRTVDGGAASAAMASIFATEPFRFIGLQKVLRSGDSEKIQPLLTNLFEKLRTEIETEWDSWLTIVMEAFGGQLEEVCKDLGGTVESLTELSGKYDQIQHKITLVNNRKVQKARRKSLVRRKSTASIFQDEVRALEALITKSKADLSLDVAKEMECDHLIGFSKQQTVLSEDCNRARPQAQSSQKDYRSLKGLHSWSPVEVGESRISVASIGLSRNTCNTLVYNLSRPQEVFTTITTKTEVPAGMKKSFRKYSGPVSAFLDSHVQRLADSLTSYSKNSASTISQNIQSYMWCLGRLDFTAGELQGLMNRYKCRLQRTGSLSFVLAVDFEGRASKFDVEFEMGLTYPSLPLEVRIVVWEGDIDVEGVLKALAKNARPGFGYLSRACDIVSVYVN